MKWIIANYFLLMLINLFMVYSSTYKLLVATDRLPISETIQTLLFLIIFTIISVVLLIKSKIVKKLVYNLTEPLFVLTLIALMIVLTGAGEVVGNASSSIRILFFNFQPVEVAKITMILYLAKKLSKNPNLKDNKKLFKIISLPLLSFILIFLEPDLGGVVIMFALLMIILILNGKELKKILKYILAIIATGIAGLYLVYKMFPRLAYQFERFEVWKNPFDHLDSAGSNIVQSYIAISNGGLLGNGYLNSAQNTGFLYASSTDFIFAIIIEETGLIGGFITIFLITFLAIQVYFVGYRSKKRFDYLYCSGFAALILIQTAVNVGGVTGVIPMTGVTLPFISKGINSLLFMSFGLLFVLIIEKESKREKNAKKRKKRALHTHSVL